MGEPTPNGVAAGGQPASGSPLLGGGVDCPATQPQNGAACSGPQQCDYGYNNCDASLARCVAGVWEIGYYSTICTGSGGAGGGESAGNGGRTDSSGASAAGAPQSTMSPPVAGYCPVSVPVSATACVKNPSSGPWQCEYGPDTGCGAILASCDAGVWSLGGYAVNCAGGSGGAGGDGPVIGEGGAAPEPMVECPAVMPSTDAPCYKPSNVTSYRCDYAVGCAAYAATCTGSWQISATKPPVMPCSGGGSGE